MGFGCNTDIRSYVSPYRLSITLYRKSYLVGLSYLISCPLAPSKLRSKSAVLSKFAVALTFDRDAALVEPGEILPLAIVLASVALSSKVLPTCRESITLKSGL